MCVLVTSNFIIYGTLMFQFLVNFAENVDEAIMHQVEEIQKEVRCISKVNYKITRVLCTH